MNHKMLHWMFIYAGILFAGCSNRIVKSKEIKGYLVTHTVSPSLGPGNADLKRSDTMLVKVFFWKNQVLYHTGHMSYYLKEGKDIVKAEMENFIFVYTQNSSEGYFYDLFRNKPPQKIGVDSFLKHEWYAQIKLYPIFLESDYKLDSVKKDIKRNTLLETYSLKGKGEDSLKTGTISLLYSNGKKNNKFSLSKELDSIKGMQLIKVGTINNARELKEYNMKLPRIEIGYNLEEIKEFKDKAIFNYFEGYKKEN